MSRPAVLGLGLGLSLRGGREAWVRLLLTAGAVAAGVAVLLSVLAGFNGFQATNNRACWECSGELPPGAAPPTPGPGTELWYYSEDTYRGLTVRRLDVAALGPGAPVVPGLRELPAAGHYDVSPALARLLASAPRDELGARFPGAAAGTVGDAALTGPDDLVIVVGRTPQQMRAMPGAAVVDRIATRPRLDSAGNLYQFAFTMVAIALVFPLLTLIATATRLAAARREQRFAAFRLVGATPGQINVIASVEAVAGALLGTVVGIGLSQLLHASVAGIAVSGDAYFPYLVTPSTGQYAAVLVGVPLAAAGAAVLSLRRVRISPLGASRRTTPPPPRAWRIAPLLLGLVVLGVAAFLPRPTLQGPSGSSAGSTPSGVSQALLPVAELGLLLVMSGLVLSGSWLTMMVARLASRAARGAPGLLSARRLADNPKAAFRSVSGLVLAVFVGTAIAAVVPAIENGMHGGSGGSLDNVLRVSFVGEGRAPGTDGSLPVRGLAPAQTAGLLARLRSFPGADALPVYQDAALGEPSQACNGPYDCAPTEGVVRCADLVAFPALGACPTGTGTGTGTGSTSAVRVDFGNLFYGSSGLHQQVQVVDASARPAQGDPTTQPVSEMLIRTGSADQREQIRTLLGGYLAAAAAPGLPQTFAEVSASRSRLYDEIERITFLVCAITLVVAGCSLTVSVVGGLLERKRPFTLLRVSGTPIRTLYWVVLLESALPLLLTALVAAAAGLGTAIPLVGAFASDGVHAATPGGAYFLTLGMGLLVSLVVIWTTLPLLRRLTEPEEARFE